jgi:glycosyltransferase involved in cell wall biosynthesis
MVTFAGHKSYDEIPSYYSSAKALILPSRSETWGLVVNEAMAAGLPVIVSQRCGCADDLVTEGDNGWVFDPDAPTALTNILLKLDRLSDEQVRRMGDRSRAIIENWSLNRFAVALEQAAMRAADSGPRASGIVRRIALAMAFAGASVLRM